MKIAVNTRLLQYNRLEGIGIFMLETLKRISTRFPEHEFYFIFDRPFHESFVFNDNVKPIVIGPQARHPILFYLWFEYSIPKVLRKIKPDVFLSPDGFLSLSAKISSVAVIHDLNFEHYPKALPWLVQIYYKYFFPRFAEKAARIATVSEFSKQDISKNYNISPEKIAVCYNGVCDEYHSLNDQKKQKVREQYTGGHPYFLYVGSLNPRKNIPNLLLAYDKLRKSRQGKIKLLLVGEKMWGADETEHVYKNLVYKEDVVFAGRLQDRDLQEVMASALALVYVSFFEGFGIPLIEAFSCGVPVITSNVSSMPEVAAGAAILVDPFSVETITQAMLQLAGDETLQKELIAKGHARAKNFTWDETARVLWDCIINAAEIHR